MNTKKYLTELKQIIAEAQAEIERIESELKRTTGRARTVDEVEYYISNIGEVSIGRYNVNTSKKYLIENNNAFIDKQSTEREAKRNNLIVQLREVCKNPIPVDWSNKQQDKFDVQWDYVNDIWYLYNTKDYRRSDRPVFLTQKALLEFYQTLPDEDVKLLVEGVE